MSNNNNILDSLNKFHPINLEEIKDVELMNRIDTKFVFHKDLLPTVLLAANNNYEILNIDGHLNFKYFNEYFDTPTNYMYIAHHNGIANRYKIRIREYVETKTRFLEIKFKNNKKKTIKKRMLLQNVISAFSEAETAFIHEYSTFNATDLQSSIINNFHRITLANRKWNERITIDTFLEFKFNSDKILLDNLVICEVKKSPGQLMTPMEHLLRQFGIKPFRLSKYCLGTVLFKKQIKSNLYKEKIIMLTKKLNYDYSQ